MNKRSDGRTANNSVKCSYGIVGVILLVLSFTAPGFAVPACPDCVTDVVQPDGTVLQVRPYGDEWSGRMVTEDGYTVIQATDGWYYFATLDNNGALAPSSHRALPGSQRSAEDIGFIEQTGQYLAATALPIYSTPDKSGEALDLSLVTRGQATTNNVLVILIRYPDEANTIPSGDFSNLVHQNGFDGIGSMNNFYLENSYGAFGLNGATAGWYTSSKNKLEYANSKGSVAAAQLAKEAVLAAVAAGVNFAPYDNNNDGMVDGLFIVHAGPGAEAGYPDYPWSHKWSLSGAGVGKVVASGKTIDAYSMEPELLAPGRRITIGVFCHEYGHQLGLPDLYDYTGKSSGVGYWDVMGSGSWLGPSISRGASPSHFSAWSKSKLGWLTPVNVTSYMYQTPLRNIENFTDCYRMWMNTAMGDEYFLIENRQKVGFDTYLPGCGIAIWHIDDAKLWKGNNNDETHKLVDLEEADGKADLDNLVNRGDDGDLFDGSGLNTYFDDWTNPNSFSYAGIPCSLYIYIQSGCGNTMYIDMNVQGQGSGFDVMIRDCTSDVGAEPDGACTWDWVRSPDVWIDNDFDNIADPPAPGLVNIIKFRAWNINGGVLTGASLRAQFVEPSMGLYFPNPKGFTMVDEYTKATKFNYSSIISSDVVFVNWKIPPPLHDHYCIGAILDAPGDPQINVNPLNDNNVAQINMWALYEKAGQAVSTRGQINGFAASQEDTVTVFHSVVRGCNTLGGAGYFVPRFELLDLPSPSWRLYFADSSAKLVFPDSCIDIDVYAEVTNPVHNDSATVIVKYTLASNPNVITGHVKLGYVIDDHAAASIGDLQGSVLECPPDLYDYCPSVQLTWTKPSQDETGDNERIRWYFIYRDDNSGVDSLDKYDSVAVDADPNSPGFQWYDYEGLANGATRYYRTASVDGAFSLSELSNTATVGTGCCDKAGDANNDGSANVGDVVYIISYVFKSGTPPLCMDEGDANNDCLVNVADAVYMISFVFKGGTAPNCGCFGPERVGRK